MTTPAGVTKTRPMVLFGRDVWFAAGERRALRIGAVLIMGYALVGFPAPSIPMHTREYLVVYGPALTDRLHLVGTAMTSKHADQGRSERRMEGGSND